MVVEQHGDFSFRGSELLMVHVMFNLIKNALRHIAKTGHGGLVIRIDGASRRLVVRDAGGGIAPEVLPHIFQRFYTATGGSDGVLGSGIGLAFCRDVMTALGGSIDCRSVQGEFSEFELRFPSA